jgi:hypothetical protein
MSPHNPPAHTPPPPLPPAPTPPLPYSGWKATAIGSNKDSATAALNSDYKPDLTLADATLLALKTLTKAMDTTAPSSEKLEVATLTRDVATGRIRQHVFTAAETDAELKKLSVPAAAAAAAGGGGGGAAAPPS